MKHFIPNLLRSTLACCLLASEGSAATLHVPADYPTIQSGIDAAAFGDVVLVAPGTYTDYETRNFETSCAFLKDGVHVRSEKGSNLTTIDIIDMAGPQPSAITAVVLPSDVTSIEGFTIEGRERGLGAFVWLCGNLTIRDCVFQNFDGGPTTGGAVIVVGNGSIIDSKFLNCKSASAGAIWCTDGHLDLVGCLVQDCYDTPVYIEETGGYAVSATVVDCQFIENTSAGGAGGLLLGYTSEPTIVKGCLFQGNINSGAGAGGLDLGEGVKTVEQCLFIDNGAMGANGQGGGLASSATTPTVRNNTFYGNYKTANPGGGSAVKFWGTTLAVFEKNVVVASHGGPAVDNTGAISMGCNVYWDNAQGIGIPLAPTDREVDPQFCDPAIYDLTLRTGSPCLPSDPLGCGLIGALGEGCGSVSVKAKSWGAIKGSYR